MESILTSIKKLLGLTEEYEAFDGDIIIHINTVFSILNQLGIGPEKGFSIKGKEETWDTYIDSNYAEMVKTFVYLKVRLIFDPPSSSYVVDSINRSISELEWRLAILPDIMS